MKVLKLLFLILFLIGLSTSNAQKELPINSSLPLGDVTMMDVSGKMLSLNDMKSDNGLLVIFSCNTCPYVKAWESRYLKVAELATENKIGMILLNPNEKFRSDKESLKEMKKISTSMNYTFPYVVDKDHKLADAFGATKTPHVYLFNKENKLVYVGAIDDNSGNEAKVKKHFLMDAIKELGAHKSITTQTSKALGCSIKRVK